MSKFTSFFLVILITLLHSCNNLNQDNTLTNSVETNPNFKENLFVIQDLELLNGTTLKSHKGKDIIFQESTLNNLNFSQLEQILEEKVENNFESNIIGILLYSNQSDISNTANIQINDLLGFSIYYIKQNFIYHKLYYNDLGNFQSFDYFSCKAFEKVFIADNLLCADWLDLNLDKEVKNMLHFAKTDENTVVTPTNNEMALKRAVADYIGIPFINGESKIIYGNDAYSGGDCTPSCENTWYNDCVYGHHGYGTRPLYCEDVTNGPCPKIMVEDLAYNNNLSFLPSIFQTNLYYNLRDNFLNNYETGKKYDDYFYILDKYLLYEDYNNIDLLNKILIALPNINNAVNSLLNGNNQDIIINNLLKNQLLDILNEMRNLNSNTDYQAILTDVAQDIHSFSGKTKIDFINAL